MKDFIRRFHRPAAASTGETVNMPAPPGVLARLRALMQADNAPWLLLTWDVAGMEAALLQPGQETPLATASSRQGRFGTALDEVLRQLAVAHGVRPRRVALAARHVLPTVSELPVLPDKPRRPEQMRELIQPDLEPVLAEFGSLWSMGAVLQARGYLSPEERERLTLEESVRRQNRASQLRYGEIAIEQGLIDRDALDECLDQQAALQNLDASLMAGWCGRMDDKHPLWLVCGVGMETFREWRTACARHKLALHAILPLSWLASEPPPAVDTTGEGRHEKPVPCIDLEIRVEEVVAILRRQGQVSATRSEARIERTPTGDWIGRLIADWTAETRARLRLHFMDAADDHCGEALADDLGLSTGHPCSIHYAGETRRNLWRNLWQAATTTTPQLPRLVPKELRGAWWKNHDLLRVAAIAAVLLVLAGAEGVQRYRLYQLQTTMHERQEREKKHAQLAQQEALAGQKLMELAKELDSTRRQLEPLVNDRARLNRIVAMRVDLPDLLYLLAQAVGSDAVMEEVHHDNTRSEGSAIQVVSWSPSYTGAQDFVNRMAVLARDKGYGVSQMEIRERKGRNNRNGHEVKFWLLLEDGDLGASETAAPAPASTPAARAASGGGISSQAGNGRKP